MTRTRLLDQRSIDHAVARVSPREVSEPAEQRTEIFASLVWTRVIEPGDAVASQLIAALGAAGALQAVIDGEGVEQLRARLSVISDTSGSPEDAIRAATLTAALARWRPRLNLEQTLRDVEIAQQLGFSFLSPQAAQWPKRLHDLEHHMPVGLWYRGDIGALQAKALAVVGARASSSYGEVVTRQLITDVVKRSVTIISGGAYGIDAVAHQAALASEAQTIALLAGGLDRLYPSGNTELLNRVARTGLLCSEVAPGTSPSKWRFLQRNRLIAALADAVLVTEAGHRSGSLNTAGHAAQLGRPLGAVPGPITSSGSSGCHRLLREYDAACIRNAQDVMELLQLEDGEQAEVGGYEYTSMQRRVCDATSSRTVRDAESIASLAGISVTDTSRTLAELQLLGAVMRRASGWVRSG